MYCAECKNIPDPNIPDPNIPDPNIPDPNIPDPNIPDPNIPDPNIPQREFYKFLAVQFAARVPFGFSSTLPIPAQCTPYQYLHSAHLTNTCTVHTVCGGVVL